MQALCKVLQLFGNQVDCSTSCGEGVRRKGEKCALVVGQNKALLWGCC